jgi:hypothetical protein
LVERAKATKFFKPEEPLRASGSMVDGSVFSPKTERTQSSQALGSADELVFQASVGEPVSRAPKREE